MYDTEKLIAAKTWECVKGKPGKYADVEFVYQGCGVIEPLVSGHTAIRRGCACETAAQEKSRAAHEEYTRLVKIKADIDATYAWLGGCWSCKDLTQKTFDNFNKDRQPEAFEMAKLFAEAPYGTLVLHGSFGTGKTHLLAAICNELRERREKPMGSRFMTAPDLFEAIQDRMSDHKPYTTFIEQAASTSLLVIDDIDKAKRSDFREEIYFSILDKRARRGLPNAISTNRLSELESFVGGACASRLSTGQVEIAMKGKDYRRQL